MNRPIYCRTSGLPINECNCCRCRPAKETSNEQVA